MDMWVEDDDGERDPLSSHTIESRSGPIIHAGHSIIVLGDVML